MFKKFLLFLLLFMALPAFSGEFEEASREHAKILVYMYTPECGYCKKFDPLYSQVLQKYGKSCKFLKINAATEYGNFIMRRLNASYVPYVALINNQKQTLQRITPTCLLNLACTKDALDKFVNN